MGYRGYAASRGYKVIYQVFCYSRRDLQLNTPGGDQSQEMLIRKKDRIRASNDMQWFQVYAHILIGEPALVKPE